MAIEQFIPEEHDIDWLIARRDRLERDRDALLEACKAQEEADKWFGASNTGHALKIKAKDLIQAAIALAEKEGKL